MASFSKDNLAQLVSGFKARLKHAFALAPDREAPTLDDLALPHRVAATTAVEAPFEDVTRGVLNSFAELEELSGRKILDGERIITPNRAAQGEPKVGVDIYLSTSSAGGGLQMMVAGAVQSMTGES